MDGFEDLRYPCKVNTSEDVAQNLRDVCNNEIYPLDTRAMVPTTWIHHLNRQRRKRRKDRIIVHANYLIRHLNCCRPRKRRARQKKRTPKKYSTSDDGNPQSPTKTIGGSPAKSTDDEVKEQNTEGRVVDI